MTTQVGMIGVGLMGHGIARNVLKAGFGLHFLEHAGNQPVEDLLGAGAVAYANVQQVAQASNVLILCVTGAPEVQAILTGEQGALAALRPGTVVVDCSTSVPAVSKRMAQLVAQAGAAYLDAPMTRTAQAAHDGTLHLLVGGDAQVLEQVRPVLDAFTEKVHHVGDVGNGHSLKLLHNFVSLGSIALIAEAAACAEHNGVDPATFVEVLAAGGGAGVPLERLRPYITAQDASSLPFFMANAQKDLGYYVQMAGDSDSAQRIGQAVEHTYEAAVQSGGPQTYVPELVRLLAERH
ncbi:NAD(P)-dependent oxidoreductase [Lampropedia puyangensis]|uniref:NAD(P)-dependent oxidoreductase n=1 Tax=Lampropedia puyangensis TaxID=1330072 RepID=A0A4S8F857_9BURK|nr:NAD(P)-dependent oxidoreductase [Lampropedia puyangensis]THU03690.1 NAD(P)-dependent oxidoreductase [Lampropedia puyangensis]